MLKKVKSSHRRLSSSFPSPTMVGVGKALVGGCQGVGMAVVTGVPEGSGRGGGAVVEKIFSMFENLFVSLFFKAASGCANK